MNSKIVVGLVLLFAIIAVAGVLTIQREKVTPNVPPSPEGADINLPEDIGVEEVNTTLPEPNYEDIELPTEI